MNENEQKKCYALAEKLKADGYKVFLIQSENNNLSYVAIELEGRKILVDYEDMDSQYGGCYQVGQVVPKDEYAFVEKGAKSPMRVGYSYIFKEYKKDFPLDYFHSIQLDDKQKGYPSFDGLLEGYIVDDSVYQKAFYCWMKGHKFCEVC